MERLLQLWREYQTGVDELVDWLMSILSLMRNDEICDDSLDMLEAQLEQLRVSYFSMATSRRCTIFWLCCCQKNIEQSALRVSVV